MSIGNGCASPRDEVEEAGCFPQLVHAHKAKLMLGQVSKTDRLDARGLIRLQRTGTLPTVWIPSRELRDLRDLPRTRMLLVRQRTHVSLLYDRVRKRRGHQKAICAVARHLAEATYWVLTKREPYREPGSSTGA